MDISVNGQPYRPLAVRYPTRVHSGLKLATMYLFLNTRQPPFTSLKARQALNYAIDRARIMQLLDFGSPGQAAPTCQILPAGSPGYQRYCPYTAGAAGRRLARPRPGHGGAARARVRHHAACR